jgi:hypothetical protein
MTKDSRDLGSALGRYGIALKAVTVALVQGHGKAEVDARLGDVDAARQELERVVLACGLAGPHDASAPRP